LTFRTGKKHKVQESTKSGKNALKLASRFQRFLNTGIASKRDLKEIDDRFISQVSQQGDKVLMLLDQLKEVLSGGRENGGLERTCDIWAKWLSSLNSKENLGYSSVKYREGTENVLLESVIDTETHLFQMLLAFKSTISSALKSPGSFDDKIFSALQEGASEIIEAFQQRQRMLGKMTNYRR